MSEKAELEKDRTRPLGEGLDDPAHFLWGGASEQLALSTAQLQRALNAIPAYTWYATPSGVLTFVNERKADYLGLPKNHPLRLGVDTGAAWDSFTPLLHPDDRDEMRRVWSDCLRTGAAGEASIRLRNAQGEYRWFTGRAEPLRANDGTLLYWIGVSFDIEEREQLTRALRNSQEELRQILDLTPQFVGVFGPHRERLYANKITLDYLGLTLDEWRDGRWGSLIHPDDVERLRGQWDRASLSGTPVVNEYRLRRSDGNYRWVQSHLISVKDEKGNILRWYAASTDIEDRKREEERLERENIALREQISQTSMFEEIVGTSAPLQEVLTQVSKVAPSDSTVLVLGETGTGKELIARAIHERSRRAARAFIGVNCAAIPVSLIASELFGHEKGAFSGAGQRRLGRFEAAHGGTIFLDEVGDLPMDIQIALLRVLQEREIERIGRDTPVPVDVRVIAATHRDLKKLVSEGKFRQDLFYRLNVVPITMPPLRERAADIPLLVAYFIARFGRKARKKYRTIERRTLEAMKAYDWPGNVRELQNVIERAVTLSDSDIFVVDEAWLKREPPQTSRSSAALGDELSAREKEVIEAALVQCGGRVAGPAGAAAMLGLPTSTLDSKIKRLGINKYRFKPKPR